MIATGKVLWWNSLLAEEDGGTAVETATTLTVVFTLIFCFMEICLALYSKEMISECAREGTRYAMYHGASCPSSSNPTCEATASQVNTYVSGLHYPNLGMGVMTVATTYCSSTGTNCSTSGSEAVGNVAQVQMTYVFPIKMPFVPKTSLTMSSVSRAGIVQ